MTEIRDSREAFRFIESFRNFEKTAQFSNRHFRLDRMESLLDLFENPERAFKVFHIAGTKGKGSTALFLSALLKEAGFVTGLYTSPHVQDYAERIQVQNKYADGGIVTRLTREIALRIGELTFRPTTFELLTLLGFLYFREMKCDYAVIETGLGGRLDATNVVKPLASIITPIDIEHTDFLGDTLKAIAREKAGIIKLKTPVFSSSQEPDARAVLAEKAVECHSPLFFLEEEVSIRTNEASFAGQSCMFEFVKSSRQMKATLKMLGDFQRENAALAALVFDHFFPGKISTLIAHAYAQVCLPGRMEVLQNQPLVLIDGAHTINSVEKLAKNLEELNSGTPRALVFGCLAGKKGREMIEILKGSFEQFIITHPSDLRRTDLNDIADVLKTANKKYVIEEDTERAIALAQKLLHNNNCIVVTGSFYLIGRFKDLFKLKPVVL